METFCCFAYLYFYIINVHEEQRNITTFRADLCKCTRIWLSLHRIICICNEYRDSKLPVVKETHCLLLKLLYFVTTDFDSKTVQLVTFNRNCSNIYQPLIVFWFSRLPIDPAPPGVSLTRLRPPGGGECAEAGAATGQEGTQSWTLCRRKCTSTSPHCCRQL